MRSQNNRSPRASLAFAGAAALPSSRSALRWVTISALAVFPNNLIMLDSITGEEVARIPLGEVFRNSFKHPYALIHRADLHKVLLDAHRQSDLLVIPDCRKAASPESITTNAGRMDSGLAASRRPGMTGYLPRASAALSRPFGSTTQAPPAVTSVLHNFCSADQSLPVMRMA